MKISICVPTSRPDTVALTIQSILKQSWTHWELIAVGQGDSAHERTVATKEAVLSSTNDERVHYVHTPEKGATRARNKAMMVATGEIFAFIDDDCEAHEDWLSTFVAYFERDPEIGLVGGAVIAPPKTGRGIGNCPTVSPTETIYEPEKMGYTPPTGWDWISCNVALRRDVAEKIGPWDDFLGPGTEFPAADDTDYLLRAEALNIKMATTPKALVTHTFGYRYNQQLLKHLRNYSIANGGLAGKLTLMGDIRGESWLNATKRERLTGWLKPFRPHRFFRSLTGWLLFSKAYDYCLMKYQVENNLLHPLDQSQQAIQPHENTQVVQIS